MTYGYIRVSSDKQTVENQRYDALTQLLRRRPFREIYVKELCLAAGIHRSTFYEHYQDINDLMLKTKEELPGKSPRSSTSRVRLNGNALSNGGHPL